VSGTNWEGTPQFAVNDGGFQNSATFTGLAAGTYWVKVKDASDCIDSLRVDLIQQFPDVDFTTMVTSATCSIAPDGRIEVSPIGGNGAFTYSSNGTSFQASNVLIVPEGSYTVYVKDGNGCTASHNPIVVNKINTVVVDAEADRFICEGTSYDIVATSNATNIAWTPANTLTNSNTLSPTASPSSTTEYYVTASFGTCEKTDSITLNVWTAPIADAGNDVEICYGITAQLSGNGGTSYSWVPASTFVTSSDIQDPIVRPTIPTSYFLHVIDDNGCRSLQTDEVKVIVTPAVEIFAGNDTLVAMDQPLQLSAKDVNASGINDWQWTDTRFLNDPSIPSPTAIFTEPFPTSPYEYTYRITGTTPIGCQGFDDIKIKVYKGPEIYVPTAFTPNNDGRNDILFALPVGMKELKFFKVFNRWGQTVFVTQDATRGWDGFIGGHSQSNSVYVWTAEGIDYMGNRVVRRGMVTLIR
jgi:gliding motility-associated-like protein